MSQSKYFVIPFANVPKDPAYTVWFASWSTERPIVEPGMPPPFVVGVTTDDKLPAGATLLADGSKDPPPPPPVVGTGGLSEYQTSFTAWMLDTKDV
jgi:hypothetical protein